MDVSKNGYVFLETRRKIIVVSEPLRKTLIKAGVGERKIELIYNGIDVDKFTPFFNIKRARKLNQNKVFIGTAGRLSKEKGHDILLRSIAEIIRLRRDLILKVIIYGKGIEKENLELLKTNLRLEKIVEFSGFKENIGEALSKLDIFVLPSFIEGFPMALLEAGAVGLPVVASEVGGIPEMVRHGKDGFLTPVGSVEGMAKAIIRLVDSPNLRVEMGASFYKRVSDNFGLDRMVEKTIKLYKEIMDQPV